MEKQVIKGFIEVTNSTTKLKVFVNVANYEFIEKMNGKCVVASVYNMDVFTETEETYEEVMKLIQESLNEDKLKQYQ